MCRSFQCSGKRAIHDIGDLVMKTIGRFLRKLANWIDPPAKLTFVATLDVTPFLQGIREMEIKLAEIKKIG